MQEGQIRQDMRFVKRNAVHQYHRQKKVVIACAYQHEVRALHEKEEMMSKRLNKKNQISDTTTALINTVAQKTAPMFAHLSMIALV